MPLFTMKFQIALWIFIMGINLSLTKAPKRHCYQAEKVYTKDENIPKARARRSLQKYGHVIKPKQNGVCSTWGNFQYRTFDGELYRFPGICNYIFASHCGKHYEDFNIQIEQSWDKGLPTISQLSVKLNELLIEVIDHTPSVHGEIIELPYSNNGIRIEKIGTILQISAKVLLELTWEENNIIHLSLNKKYMGETCGLCGNYNGNANDDIVYSGNVIDPLMFGARQKLRKPNEDCKDPEPESTKKCSVYRAMCLKHLRNHKWINCNRLVNPEPYIEAYMLDMCLCNATANYRSFCLCSTITEYSRQCALAGGTPPNWRSPSMCYKPCPDNLIYKECSPPCISTCSNPGQQYFCDGPCVSGCICPKGLVLDDITNLGCIPIDNCACTINKIIYPPGSVYNGTCRTCLCSGGHWNCHEVACYSTCSVEGGSHITTFDQTQYTFHGQCVYMLTKPCADNTFMVNVEMKKCAYSESGTCLTRVFLFLDDGSYEFQIQYDNSDFPHVTFDKERMAKAGVNIFWPSSFFLIVHTNKGLYLEVQLVPVMQLHVVLDPSYKEKMCGLCGDFNSIQKDDFQTSSGALESNVVDFANSWKTSFKCKSVKHFHEHPCIYGMAVEKYANYWCNTLLDPKGSFAACHSSVSPGVYQQNCLFDTCACKRAEDCLCAAISSYVWACAASGVTISGWRDNVCRNFLQHCPPSFVYSYTVSTCIPTCRSLSEPDPTCNFKFNTVDGCVCPNGTYLNDRGVCVKREDCPCYYKGFPVSANEPLHVGRLTCNCTNGLVHCIDQGIPECPHPMIYFDCDKAGETAKGAECSRTCDTSTIQCYSPLCVSGCLCPKGFILNGNRTCIKEEECPCVHNGRNYNSGDVATLHCNQCVCRNKTWVCDGKAEKGICTLYGEGHFITFDNKRYTINGDCEYTLAQDYCDVDHLWNGTFKVISENIPCGTTGTSCSKAIIVYLGTHKLILTDGSSEVVERSSDVEIPYKTRRMGLFLIIETKIGLILVWDRKTSIYIHLSTQFKGKVCGLCGNFDGNGNNDFTTRSQCVVEDEKQFIDSWKVSPYCSEVYISKDPCIVHPYRMAWAQKMCNIILSHVFAPCHSEVDPEKYYEACIRDTCACDTGGDCDCFCTAVSAYAQACSEACLCVKWRSPTVCPMFCDFYNKESQCNWYYKPCGAQCMKTCRNPKGLCISNLLGLEGCYPRCPKDKPYFNEDEMQCVSQCGCLDNEQHYYMLGEKVESCNVCEICVCTSTGILCQYDSHACNCEYEGQVMKIGEVIKIEDGFGGCKKVFCGLNGTSETPCYSTTESSTGFFQTTTLSSKTTEVSSTIKSPETSTTLGKTEMSTESQQSTQLSTKIISTSLGRNETAKSTVGSSAVTSSLTTVLSSPRLSTISTTPISSSGFTTTATTKPLTKASSLSSMATEVSSTIKGPETSTSLGNTEISTGSLQSTISSTKLISSTSFGRIETTKPLTVGSSAIISTLKTALSSPKLSTMTTTPIRTSGLTTTTKPFTKASTLSSITTEVSKTKSSTVGNSAVTSSVTTALSSPRLSTRSTTPIRSSGFTTTATTKPSMATKISSTIKIPETSTTPGKTEVSTGSLQSTILSTKMISTSLVRNETTKSSTFGSSAVTSTLKTALSSARLSTITTTPIRTSGFSTTTKPFTKASTLSSITTEVSSTIKSTETSTTLGKTEMSTESRQSTQLSTKIISNSLGSMETTKSSTVGSSAVTSSVTTGLSSTRLSTITTTPIRTSGFTTTTKPFTKASTLSSMATKVSSTIKSPETSTTLGKTEMSTESLQSTQLSKMISTSLGRNETTKSTVGSSPVTSSLATSLSSPRLSTRSATPISSSGFTTTTTTTAADTTKPLTKASSLSSMATKVSSTIKSPETSTTLGNTEVSTGSLQSTILSSKMISTFLGINETTKSSTVGSSVVTSTLTTALSSPRFSTISTTPIRSSGFSTMTTTKPFTKASTLSSMSTKVSSTIKKNETSTTLGKIEMTTGSLQSTILSTKGISKTLPLTSLSERDQIMTGFDKPVIITINSEPLHGTEKAKKPAYNGKCANITCNEDGTFTVIEKQCPLVENITCVNETPPAKIYDQDGCCFHYECLYCVGDKGIKKYAGDTWIDDCYSCFCDQYMENNFMKAKVFCFPIQCQTLDFTCDKAWLKPYVTFTEEDRCCPTVKCQCDPLYCKYQTCSLGYEAVPTVIKGDCCATINCRPMNVCIADGAVYKIGHAIAVNRSSCMTCTCSEVKDPKTGFNAVVCEPILCMMHCPLGYVYQKSDNECCGTCIQTSCIVIATDGSSLLLKPGESPFLSNDNCTQYSCILKGNTFVTSSQTQVCPRIDEEECTSGLLEKSPDGCCNICKAPKTCRVQTNVTEISRNGCSAYVRLTYCEGWCPSAKKFSEMSQQMEGKCGCCTETETTMMEVELVCDGDTDNIKITMSFANKCACLATMCTP